MSWNMPGNYSCNSAAKLYAPVYKIISFIISFMPLYFIFCKIYLYYNVLVCFTVEK